MAFHRLIQAGLTGTRFVLFGDGRQQRDFTFVLDAVDALMLAARVPAGTETFNIAGGASVTMNQAVELVQEITGSTIQVERVPPHAGDVLQTSADLSKSRAVLGYAPRVNLREGLREQIESLEQRKLLAASGG
jgi:nucleoside-diphosphate-sugar epimerase